VTTYGEWLILRDHALGWLILVRDKEALSEIIHNRDFGLDGRIFGKRRLRSDTR